MRKMNMIRFLVAYHWVELDYIRKRTLEIFCFVTLPFVLLSGLFGFISIYIFPFFSLILLFFFLYLRRMWLIEYKEVEKGIEIKEKEILRAIDCGASQRAVHHVQDEINDMKKYVQIIKRYKERHGLKWYSFLCLWHDIMDVWKEYKVHKERENYEIL